MKKIVILLVSVVFVISNALAMGRKPQVPGRTEQLSLENTLIRGQVVDKETKQPIANAQIIMAIGLEFPDKELPKETNKYAGGISKTEITGNFTKVGLTYHADIREIIKENTKTEISEGLILVMADKYIPAFYLIGIKDSESFRKNTIDKYGKDWARKIHGNWIEQEPLMYETKELYRSIEINAELRKSKDEKELADWYKRDLLMYCWHGTSKEIGVSYKEKKEIFDLIENQLKYAMEKSPEVGQQYKSELEALQEGEKPHFMAH